MTHNKLIEQVDAAMAATRNIYPPITRSQCQTIILAAREYLAAPEQSEPVAWLHAETKQAFTSEPPPALKAKCRPLIFGDTHTAPKAEPVNQTLLSALKASTAILHTLPNNEKCRCSQCEFVVLRNAAIAAAEQAQGEKK